MSKEMKPECALCNVEVRLCRSKEGTGPRFCPTKTKEKELQRALKKYQDQETMRFAKAASLQEAECYVRREEKPFVLRPTKTRVEEIIEFVQKMDFRKLGVA
ncbi:MAG: DUF1847 domain-containing protein, partial [Deltaproteobacteria bacterium]|nr:DUF1847 domain-containing protein [Deltaproteobacteria bacterium]